MKKSFFGKCTVCFFLLGFLANSLHASIQPPSYLDLDTGYRWDKISNRFSYIRAPVANSVFGNYFQLNELSSFQLGAKGQLAFCNIVLKGSGHYGWMGDGKYSSSTFKSHAHGHTIDGSGGIGYFFCLAPCWGVTPLIGGSYDQIHAKMPDVFRSSNERSLFDDIEYESTFTGGWAGLDLTFEPSPCFDVVLGYELHRAYWRNTYSPTPERAANAGGSTTEGFNIKQTSPNIWGHVFAFDLSHTFCNHINIGLGLKYQIWQSTGFSGRVHRTVTPFTPANAVISTKVIDVAWSSFAAMFRVGYGF